MSPRPIAEFLTSFGKKTSLVNAQESDPEHIVFIPEELNGDLGDLVEEARFQGVSEGLASAQAAFEVRFEEQRLLFEKQLEAEKAAWRCEGASSVENQINTAMEEVETALSECVSRILRPFVTEAMRNKAVRELCKSVKELLCDKELCFIEISAPEDLFDELQKRLAIYKSIKFVQSDSREVVVFANQAIVQTQFATWLGQISRLSE
jgi:hypothetical protein